MSVFYFSRNGSVRECYKTSTAVSQRLSSNFIEVVHSQTWAYTIVEAIYHMGDETDKLQRHFS